MTKKIKTMLQIKPTQLNKIVNSNKDFCFFNLDDNNKVISYKLTNDYLRYKKQFDTFRVVSTIKSKMEFLTI